jgi:hypothetical protein
MELSEEDRQAFHSQADKIADEVGATEVNREDHDLAVASVFFALDENDEAVMATLKILPRHRFLVKGLEGKTRTTRRDEAVEALNEALP